MLERFARSLTIALVVVTVLPGCAHFTKNGRQQLAYERYVRKCSKQRDRQRAKMKAPRIPRVARSQDKVTTELGGSPESATSSKSQPAHDDAQPAPDASP
jgi:hypothetical protein